MAGIRFWSEMSGLNEEFLHLAERYKQIVPIFTNVIFDTSQPHSNIIFPHMFAWLDMVLSIVREHPDTLFVLRAHPDENRPGKASLESVSQWVDQKHADTLPNLIFIDSDQALSSYELIQRSKFVMVYNSTIGLEASILGHPVISAGRARYTQLPTVFFPSTLRNISTGQFHSLLQRRYPFHLNIKLNARRFLYYQLFRSSLPFSGFPTRRRYLAGLCQLKKFRSQSAFPSSSPAMRAI